VIDLDRMEDQLARAVTGASRPVPEQVPRAPVPAPTPAPAPCSPPMPAGPSMTVPELLELGHLDEAQSRMATAGPLDSTTWATMRALLEGRRDAASAGVQEMLGLARASGDQDAWDRYWIQRFWMALECGTEQERYDVLHHCRERAYRFDELGWWGQLALLLAVMGKQDEAQRCFDDAGGLLSRMAQDARWLDALTNLLEAAAVLGDNGRVAAFARALRWPEDRLVVVGPAAVCKGSVERYRGLGLAAAGRWQEADACFGRAEAAHGAIGAGPLLARTRQQASGIRVAA
jgi:tetratricopeptide (TPR) repeat protein